MSRLKDALDKAAGKDAQSGPTAVQGPTGPPPDTAPASWSFKDPETGRESDQPNQRPIELADVRPDLSSGDIDCDVVWKRWQTDSIPLSEAAQEVPPVNADTPTPVDASPLATDFWRGYRFGQPFRDKLVVEPDADVTLVEQYRSLGAALHHHQLQGGARTVMIASAASGEGKTLTAANLALTLSESYMRQVLVIDADLRQPSIHELLQLPSSPGLTESLLKSEDGPLPIHRVSATLSVLTAGHPSGDPMSGLVSDTMSRILTEAAERFDWVIVDTPPVALLPDANLLAAMIDTALLVVSANRTPYPLIARAIQAIGEQRILGVVLNRIDERELISPYDYYGDWYQRYTESSKKHRLTGLFGKRRHEEETAVV